MIVSAGRSFPLGATPVEGGVNFCVFSSGASRLELLLFDDAGDAEPTEVIRLDPDLHRTYHYWHAFVSGLGPGQVYAYRAIGPFDPARGLRFDPEKLLLDPYGRAVAVPSSYDRKAARHPGNNTAVGMRSVVVDPDVYDWEGDAPLRRPFASTVIYEMHVAGFTRHPSSGVSPATRGTYAGMIEKIPYLRDLGVTAVELLPVFQFDPQDCPPDLVNYWGYSPVSFFAPHAGYSSRRDPLACVDEFRDLVKALHRAGIEVILDVVYNHTAEGDHGGPTLSLRGLDNARYYILEADRARYANFAGTGNTLNANESVVRRMILDSLRYWVAHMHVDGFRFDLASVLTRDETGRPLERPPVLWDIQSDPVLAGTKLIAEAWDAAGLYQVGSFIGDTWQEWNGRFRDDVRRFLKSDDDSVVAFAYRCFGSPDLYGHEERGPEQSINFVTCHDGFTLNDLVSYNDKHNDANGEGGRDGSDTNLSWNCGIEGPTDDPAIERLRALQVKNFLATTLLAVGTPMLSMGDEIRRTQRGNNNAYCQDNEISWFDWTLVEKHRDLHRFVKTLVSQRLVISRELGVQDLSLNELLREGEIQLHGVRLNAPDRSRESHSFAVTVRSRRRVGTIHAMFNAYWEPLVFELPPVIPGHPPWRRWIDTYQDAPNDIHELAFGPPVQGPTYTVQARSIVTLFAEGTGATSGGRSVLQRRTT
ncbi:MAG TPA: glycogen debranching protein GlgX [Myxococcota bacterium]|nr:glycogen debranching protein GlgX [Myxococcota bacterium]